MSDDSLDPERYRRGRRYISSTVHAGMGRGSLTSTDDVDHLRVDVDIEVSGASSDIPHPSQLADYIETAVVDAIDEYAEGGYDA